MVCDSYPKKVERERKRTRPKAGPGFRVLLGAAMESLLLDVGQRTSIDLLVGCFRSNTKKGFKTLSVFKKNSDTNHCLWYLVITTKV